MDRTALTTHPFSYSQTCDTFRPRLGQCAASRAGLGGKRFIHFFVPCAIRNRLVRKHRLEGMPRCVINAFRHLGFGEFAAADIANSDVIEAPHDVRAGLVQKILSCVGDLGVNLRRQTFLFGSLCLRQLVLKLTKTPRMLDLLPIGQRGKIFQPKVNAYATQWLERLNIRHFNHDVQEPVPAPISRKAGSILDLAFWQRPGIEYAKRIASEPEGIAVALQVPAFERHPAKRTLATIAKKWTVELLARFGVLLAHGVDRAGVDAKLFAAAGSQHIQIEAGRPALAPLERVFLCVVAEVPNEIYRPRLLVQQTVQRLHAVAVNPRAHWRFRDSSMARRMCSATESSVFSDRALSAATTRSDRNKNLRFMHKSYLYFYTAVQPTGCAPFLPGPNAGVSRSI